MADLFVQACICAWEGCQQGWAYLAPIFSNSDALHHLPNEGKKFSAMDKGWRAVIKKTFSVPQAISIAADTEVLRTLTEANVLLGQVQPDHSPASHIA